MFKLKEKHKRQRRRELNLKHSRSAKYIIVYARVGAVGMVKGLDSCLSKTCLNWPDHRIEELKLTLFLRPRNEIDS